MIIWSWVNHDIFRLKEIEIFEYFNYKKFNYKLIFEEKVELIQIIVIMKYL